MAKNNVEVKTVVDSLVPELMKDAAIRSAMQNVEKSIASLYKIVAEKVSYNVLHGAAQQAVNNEPVQKVDASVAKKTIKTAGRRRTDWMKAPLMSLRSAYYNRKRHGLDIEDALQEALAKRIPTYDRENQVFTGRTVMKSPKPRKVVAQKSSVAPGHKMPLVSKRSNAGKHALYFDNGVNMTNISNRASAPYALCLVDAESGLAVVRKFVNQQEACLLIVNLNDGKIVPEVKNGVDVVYVDTANHSLYAMQDKYTSTSYWALSAKSEPSQVMIVPGDAFSIAADTIRPATILVDANGQTEKLDSVVLDKTNDELAKKLAVLFEQNKKEMVSEDGEMPLPDEKDLVVLVKPVKTTLDGTYNNVFVNGFRLLKNHLNTDVDILFDGTLLAVHGVMSESSEYPAQPVWQLYDADLRSRVPLHKQKFNNYNIYAKSLRTDGNQLRMDMSNRATCYVKADAIRRTAGQRRFRLKEK